MDEKLPSEKDLLEASKALKNSPYSLESYENVTLNGLNVLTKQVKMSQKVELTYNEIYFVNESLRAVLNSSMIEFLCENITDKGQLPKKLVATIVRETTISFNRAKGILTKLRKHKYVIKLDGQYYIDITKIFPKRKINNRTTYRVIQIMWEMYNVTHNLSSFNPQVVGSVIYHIDMPNRDVN